MYTSSVPQNSFVVKRYCSSFAFFRAGAFLFFARCLLPEIRKFFESEEGKREFEEWKKKEESEKK